MAHYGHCVPAGDVPLTSSSAKVFKSAQGGNYVVYSDRKAHISVSGAASLKSMKIPTDVPITIMLNAGETLSAILADGETTGGSIWAAEVGI